MSNSGVWGPTPPGVNLEDNQNGSIIAAVVVVMTLASAAVGLRLFARLSKRGPGLGIDDYAVIAALILGFGNAACCLVGLHYGGGYHLWTVTVEGFIKLYQTTYAFVIIYIWSITSYKLAILLFYRRLFGVSKIWYCVTAFALLHGFEVTITWLSGCRPVSYFWNQYTDPHATGHCINSSVFYLANGIIGLAVDLSILITPIPTIMKLQMDKKQKIAVCGILFLGGFVCVASIIRIVFMDRLVKSADFTWAMTEVFIWSCVEPSIGIVCACLPTYAPLVRRWSAAIRERSKNSNGTPAAYLRAGSAESGNINRPQVSAGRAMKIGSPYGFKVGGSTSSESTTSTMMEKDIVVTKDFVMA